MQRQLPRPWLRCVSFLIFVEICTGCGKQPVAFHSSAVRVNELSPSNHTIRDDAGATGDWIELVNLGSTALNLGGYYFSDDVDTRFIHVLSESVVLPGNGYLLLWADEKPEEGPLHLGFKLSSDGEGVWFSNPQGYVVDAVEFGRAPDSGEQDLSFGRYPDITGPFRWCNSPTPGESNGEQCRSQVP